MKAFAIYKLVMTLLPEVIKAVKDAEELYTEGGKGQAKLQLAKDFIRIAYNAVARPVPFEDIVETLEKVIAAIVVFYNTIGVFFKKKS